MINYEELKKDIVTPFGEIGYITMKRTYARRLKEGEPDTEEFWQIVKREIEASDKQLKVGFTDEEKELYFKTRMQLKWSTAGRFMWQLNTKTVDRLGLPSLQNCAGVVVNEPIRPFTWTFEMLMLGSGVGYNIQRHNVYQIPKLKKKVKIERLDNESADFIVPDTREGWVKLLGKVLKAHFYTGESFTYSTQLIRSKGAHIKGFGGEASGPEELCEGIALISEILNNRSNKKLRPIDCLDIMNIIGQIVVSGNVRRSAQIALGDYDDIAYLKAKRWDLGSIPNWRAMSNNSVVCDEIENLPSEFWDTYLEGEPYGLINLDLSRLIGRTGDTKYPDAEVEVFNPCFTGKTMVAVADGRNAVSIKQLAEESTNFPVYSARTAHNGKIHWKAEIKNATAFKTGTREVVEVLLSDGSTFKCTPEHKLATIEGDWIEAQHSEGRQLAKFYTFSNQNSKKSYRIINSKSNGHNRQYKMIHNFYTGTIPNTSQGYQIHHIDGSSTNDFISNLEIVNKKEHNSLHLKTYEENPIFKMDQDLRKYYSKRNAIYRNAGKYSWNVTRTREALELFDSINVKPDIEDKNIYLDEQVHVLEVIFNSEIEEVFDLTVEDNHNFYIITKTNDSNYLNCSGVLVHNCAEQSLANKETCCLGEIYLPNITNFKEFIDCLTLCYRVCKHSLSLHCSLKDTEDIVHKNYRMGIGITGYLQATEEQQSWLKEAYEWLRKYDVQYSAIHGFPTSIKLTTVKPSGTLSLLPGVVPGCHPSPAGPYYIRRVRMASNSYLAEMCKTNGYHVEYNKKFDGTDDRNILVVEFPCKVPESTPVAANFNWKDQMDTIRRLQAEWSDNSVSCTVYYKKKDLEDIKQYLKKYYKDEIKTISFLLYSGHGFVQAPYETITKELYDELKAKTKSLTSIEIKENTFELDECASGACPIK